MDDEVELCNSTGDLLEFMGHEVTVAYHGQQALGHFYAEKAAGHPFELLILDLVIPGGMGGKAVMEELKSQGQTGAAIVSSAYSDDPVMAHYRDYGFAAALPKPYTFSNLKTVVEEVTGNLSSDVTTLPQ